MTHLKRIWHHVERFSDITDRRHIYLISAGIAFNQLLCLIPLGLLAISVASAFLDPMLIKQKVVEMMFRVLPSNAGVQNAITPVINDINNVFEYNTLAGWIAGFTLIWTASALFGSMRTGLNAIFHVETPKIFLLYKVKDLLLTLITVSLVLLTSLASPLLTMVETLGQDFIPDSTEGFVLGLTAQLVSLITSTALYLVLYRFVPNKRLPWSMVGVSTACAVVLWELARIVFTWYVNGATSLNSFYGGYVALVSLALWLYYSSLVFLVSAELGQYVYTVRHQHRPPAA